MKQTVKTVGIHLLFWCTMGILMVLVFGSPSEEDGYRQSLVFVLLLLPVLAGTTYLLLNYLVPRYLLKRRFFLFGLFAMYAIIVAAWLEIMIVMGLLMLVYEYQIGLLNPRITDLGYLTGTMVLVILPAIAIQITRQWYREREINSRLKQEKLELELYARRKELDYLKEQMRPHFLFNVLNNLYGLTLEKSDDAPELVIKVSDMLEYMLYRSSGRLVPLNEEVEHILNYIEIQKLRSGDRLTLEINIQPDLEEFSIAPLILLPFVENSFKHGVSKDSADSWITIHLETREHHWLKFSICNSIPAGDDPESTPGVGLTNVEKRLQLLYGDEYELQAEKSEQQFRVDLLLPLNRIPDETVEMHDRG